MARWVIRRADGAYLAGFSIADGSARWRHQPPGPGPDSAIVYTTHDLGAVAIPALEHAEVDTFTVERCG